jgi:hypothetical protein
VVYSGSGAGTITRDDVHNDGVPGELDNVHSDIEDVAAGQGTTWSSGATPRTSSTAAAATTAGRIARRAASDAAAHSASAAISTPARSTPRFRYIGK